MLCSALMLSFLLCLQTGETRMSGYIWHIRPVYSPGSCSVLSFWMCPCAGDRLPQQLAQPPHIHFSAAWRIPQLLH